MMNPNNIFLKARSFAFSSAVYLFAVSPAAGSDEDQVLQVPSADGTEIRVVINAPIDQVHRGTVLLVPGTGPFDEDAYFGRSGTERDFLFRDLSQAMNRAGLTTVRFAKRGVLCSPRGGVEGASYADCLDPDILITQTSLSFAQDVATAYGAGQDTGGSCLIVLGHSEGFLASARAIEEGLIQPAALIGLTPVLESPKDVLHWQGTERNVDALRQMDIDGDGRITDQEIRDAYLSSRISGVGSVEAFLGDGGYWTEEILDALQDYHRAFHEYRRARALGHNPRELYSSGGVPGGSYEWWQQWFIDERPVIDRLTGFDGAIRLFFGDRDSQTPHERQLAALQASQVDVPPENIVVFSGLGHGLGENSTYGPMDIVARDDVVAAVVSLSQQECP